jgi:iron complex transport system permease protein
VSRWSAKDILSTLLVWTAAWLIVAAACVCVSSAGRFDVPSSALVGFRLERVFLASLVGAALSLAGLAYQSVLRNILAEPYLLGVASGATLGVYCWKVPAISSAILSLHPLLSAASQPVFAFAGAMLVVFIILGIARATHSSATVLILAGVIINTMIGALTLLIYTLSRTTPGSGYFQAVLIGELQTNLTNTQLAIATTIIAIGFVFLLACAGRLNVTMLADDEARTVGVGIARLRHVVLAVASLMTAAAVAVSGPIGFVGLICPHAARRIVGVDHRRTIIASTALGAILLCLADAASRFLLGVTAINTILPVGVVTALLGGPFLLWVLVRARKTEVGP